MSSESVQPDVEPRTIKAATEYMHCEEIEDALFEVKSQSGSVYTVDLREPACECPDFQYREEVEECKHIRRVRIEVGQIDIGLLEDALAERADALQQDAEELVKTAEELTETATEIEQAIDRLQEVAR